MHRLRGQSRHELLGRAGWERHLGPNSWSRGWAGAMSSCKPELAVGSLQARAAGAPRHAAVGLADCCACTKRRRAARAEPRAVLSRSARARPDSTRMRAIGLITLAQSAERRGQARAGQRASSWRTTTKRVRYNWRVPAPECPRRSAQREDDGAGPGYPADWLVRDPISVGLQPPGMGAHVRQRRPASAPSCRC